MERYTQRDRGGGAVIRGDAIYSDWGVPEGFMGDAIDRLAAYEDTGLEPEEIEQLKGEAFGLRVDKQVLQAETAEKTREIERLNGMLADSFQGHLLGELQRRDEALSRAEAQRDAAVRTLDLICNHCGFVTDSKECADCGCPIQEWRGAQGEA